MKKLLKIIGSVCVAGILCFGVVGCDNHMPDSVTTTLVATEVTTSAAIPTTTATTAATAVTASETTPAAKATIDPSLLNQTEQNSVPEISGYKLLWNDEFNGTSMDTAIWNYQQQAPGWANNELQEYTKSEDNVFVRDGDLVIKAVATPEADGKDYYTSGKVTTQHKEDFKYGKIVVRAKVPAGQGLWPAIWMMPTDERIYGQWPSCGEIDIMEVLGNDTKTAYSTIHYGNPHAQQQGKLTLDQGSFSDGFHEYSLEWEPGEMRFYIDGVLIKTINDWFSSIQGVNEKPYPAPFNQKFYLQMNLAVGGNWPGNPDATTDFSKAEFVIDYVRVYQKPQYDTNVQKPAKTFREPLPDGNLIYNGDFAEKEDLTDETNWQFLLLNDGKGSAQINDGSIVITPQDEGTENYSIQLVQPELPLINGTKYRITFEARAAAKRDITIGVSAPTNGWIRYFDDTKLTLSTNWKTYTYEFDMTQKDDNNGRLEFNMGHLGSVAAVSLRNVRIEAVAS